ncbi:Dual specificity protein phosphatase 12 [Tetrabaena socialis]|uniref:Dual specificity protein phosphatase 12 n=1 Tax=Tetrabaena socialis TaxID=47790 RepID=A0A2J8A2I0_9CHLO|nr:Dual specificity protein phosphatase 12 [Tetrabaena socialis]|eukprot:PNH06722.1 Dual specificity protein phosphatase 12 [Tetrabaena socialis]
MQWLFLTPPSPFTGHRTFRDFYRRRREPAPDGAIPGAPESCLFLEPLQWMADTVTGVVAGKLHCPHPGCKARLGSFNWSGISNPSAAWVTPAFQLHHSKIDTVSPHPLEALANVRRPLLAAAPGRGAAVAQGATSGSGAGAAAAPPTLPASLSAAVRRLGLGSAGAGAEEDGEEQLPEPRLWGAEEEQGAEPGQRQPGTTPASSSAEGAPPPAAGDGAAGRAAAVEAPAPPGSAWFTHLILDCDGVMVDSEAASCEALRRAILEVTGFDIPHSFPQDYVEVFGTDVRSCVAHYREKFDRADWEAPVALAPRVQAAKEGHYTTLTEGGIRAFDGAERLIRKALAAGMQVGVASSGAPEKIARNLASSGLAPLLLPHAIVSASHVAAGKPEPDVYLAAMKATGCTDPWRALVVEDAVNGLKAARAAGMFAVGITNQLPEPLLAPWADLVVDHLDKIDPARLVPPPRPLR